MSATASDLLHAIKQIADAFIATGAYNTGRLEIERLIDAHRAVAKATRRLCDAETRLTQAIDNARRL